MLELLKARFSEHKGLHPDLEWLEVEQRLRVFPDAIAVLQKMEESGGEPDTIGYDEKTGKLIFCDCAKESPSGRRSLCYDEKALQGRAKNPPSSSAERKAKEIGVSLMTEELYRRLQSLGSFDLKTSSWIATPDDIRSKGGALFCERRYDTVFTFHNGADSYYSVRGFRGHILVWVRTIKAFRGLFFVLVLLKYNISMGYQNPQTLRLLDFVKVNYGTDPEFLWAKFPNTSVLRNLGNRKWYGVVNSVSASKIGIDSDKIIEIVNIRFNKGEAPEIAGNVSGIFPAWHMNKRNWITIVLDDTLSDEQLFGLVAQSFEFSK